MEMADYNKLIAEFMGAVCEMVDHTEGNEDFCKNEGIDKWLIPTWSKPDGYNEDKWGWGKYRMGYFEYHESWDWLMPVVDKIENLKYSVEIVGNYCKISHIQCSQHSKILATYKAIAEFIKWYNEKLKNAPL